MAVAVVVVVVGSVGGGACGGGKGSLPHTQTQTEPLIMDSPLARALVMRPRYWESSHPIRRPMGKALDQ